MTGSKVITLRDGTVASLAVLERLWAIEARGGGLNRTDDGGFQVTPQGIVTSNDRLFLLEFRDEARRLVRYQARVTGSGLPLVEGRMDKHAKVSSRDMRVLQRLGKLRGGASASPLCPVLLQTSSGRLRWRVRPRGEST